MSKILYIEDEHHERKDILDSLRHEGYEIVAAHNGPDELYAIEPHLEKIEDRTNIPELIKHILHYLTEIKYPHISNYRLEFDDNLPSVLVDHKYFAYVVERILVEAMNANPRNYPFSITASILPAGVMAITFSYPLSKPDLSMAFTLHFVTAIMELHGGVCEAHDTHDTTRITLLLPAYRINSTS